MDIKRLENGGCLMTDGTPKGWACRFSAEEIAGLCLALPAAYPEFLFAVTPRSAIGVTAKQFWDAAHAIYSSPMVSGGRVVMFAKRLGFWPPPDGYEAPKCEITQSDRTQRRKADLSQTGGVDV